MLVTVYKNGKIPFKVGPGQVSDFLAKGFTLEEVKDSAPSSSKEADKVEESPAKESEKVEEAKPVASAAPTKRGRPASK